MAHYRYKALDGNGRRMRGSIEADTVEEAMKLMQRSGIYPVAVEPHMVFFRQRKLSTSALIFLLRQWTRFIQSGVSLDDGLRFLYQDMKPREVRLFYEPLSRSLAGGYSLSRALRALSVPEKDLIADWIVIGEEQGDLAGAMNMAADELEDGYTFRKNLLEQLLYPFLVLIMVLLVGILMLLVVFPALSHTYAQLGVQLPFYVTPLVAVGNFLHNHRWVVAGMGFLIAAFVWMAVWRWKSGQMKNFVRSLMIRVPGFKQMLYISIYVAFAKSLSRLVSAGVDLSRAMTMLRRSRRYQLVDDQLYALEAALLEGRSLSRGARQADFVPHTAVRMMEIGEEIGQLSQMLASSACHYETLLKRRMRLLMRLVEPALILFLGLMILVMALSFFVPLLSSYQAFLN